MILLPLQINTVNQVRIFTSTSWFWIWEMLFKDISIWIIALTPLRAIAMLISEVRRKVLAMQKALWNVPLPIIKHAPVAFGPQACCLHKVLLATFFMINHLLLLASRRQQLTTACSRSQNMIYTTFSLVNQTFPPLASLKAPSLLPPLPVPRSRAAQNQFPSIIIPALFQHFLLHHFGSLSTCCGL